MQARALHFLRATYLVGSLSCVAVLAAGACSGTDTPANPSSGTQGGAGGHGGSAASSSATSGSSTSTTGGDTGTGGAPVTVGSGGSGGQPTGAGGAGTSGGASGNTGTGAGGGSGAVGTGGGSGGNGGAAGSGGKAGGGNAGSGSDGGAVARFSFFATSFAALQRLSGNQSGFGGDLRFGQANGLAGADEICRRIAETSMPANGKTWRAFLSATRGPAGTPVNAIDRVGNGPWYDRRGRLFTMNTAGLLQTRPQGADPIIANDLPNEDGVPNHDPGGGIVDNHNFLTGSTTMGVLNGTNLADTCQDWTSAAPNGGRPRCGVTWPRVQFIHWIFALNEGGCAPGATPPGADQGQAGTVGALGGYGGFYCFALTP